MPIESALFVAGVVLMFLVFIVVLAWAVRQVGDFEQSPPRKPAE